MNIPSPEDLDLLPAKSLSVAHGLPIPYTACTCSYSSHSILASKKGSKHYEHESRQLPSSFLHGPPSSIWVGEVVMRMASGNGSNYFVSAAKAVSSFQDEEDLTSWGRREKEGRSWESLKQWWKLLHLPWWGISGPMKDPRAGISPHHWVPAIHSFLLRIWMSKSEWFPLVPPSPPAWGRTAGRKSKDCSSQFPTPTPISHMDLEE